MQIFDWLSNRLWNRFNRINLLFEMNIGGKVLRVPLNVHRWSPCWRTDLIEHFVKLSPGVFLDVGANVGQTLYDYYSVEERGRYIGFEPNPRCVSVLEEIIHKNNLANYSIAPTGLWNSNTILSLYLTYAEDSCATLIADLRPERKSISQLVPVYRFDDIREALNINQISLVKIDVEGSEPQVIDGMKETLARFRPPVLCEVLRKDRNADKENYQLTVQTFMKTLNALGYSVFRIEKTDRNENGRLSSMTRLDAFPLDVWTAANADQNDYLFIPTEKENLLPKSVPIQSQLDKE